MTLVSWGEVKPPAVRAFSCSGRRREWASGFPLTGSALECSSLPALLDLPCDVIISVCVCVLEQQ